MSEIVVTVAVVETGSLARMTISMSTDGTVVVLVDWLVGWLVRQCGDQWRSLIDCNDVSGLPLPLKLSQSLCLSVCEYQRMCECVSISHGLVTDSSILHTRYGGCESVFVGFVRQARVLDVRCVALLRRRTRVGRA
jgi:hypothetical protein